MNQNHGVKDDLEARNAKMVRLARDGCSIKMLGDRFQLNVATVKRILNDNGVSTDRESQMRRGHWPAIGV